MDEHELSKAARRRGATAKVWRSGAQPETQDVAISQAGGCAAVAS